jgi:hypothetical protein
MQLLASMIVAAISRLSDIRSHGLGPTVSALPS